MSPGRLEVSEHRLRLGLESLETPSAAVLAGELWVWKSQMPTLLLASSEMLVESVEDFEPQFFNLNKRTLVIPTGCDIMEN